MTLKEIPRGMELRGEIRPEYESILSPAALRFLTFLHRHFEERRQGILRFRQLRQVQLDAGVKPQFLEHTRWIREGKWKGPYIPDDLADRRVEITGPVDRKMIINALNSGAKVFMADFEDSSSPTWTNLLDGQVNLRDAVNRSITFKNPNGKSYQLKGDKELATLMVRPRGWHLDEAHILVDGQPMSGSLVDFGLFFFHNAQNLLKRGSGPYFYLPKMESHIEARLWNDVFIASQKYVGVPVGSIRATVLLETILAAFEIDEILFELRLHSAGMNCGRWDYIFSYIKKFRNFPDMVLPDRAEVNFLKPFMAAYVDLVIQTCHKRGVHAIGGMAAQIPIKDDAKANQAAFDKVKADKLREVKAGHDGTWVAHPDLIPVATQVFNEYMKSPHQINVLKEGVNVSAADLIKLDSSSPITENGVRANISAAVQYLEAWLSGNGCVPIHHLMEDAATAEISRCQVWQWIRHGSKMKAKDGQMVQITAQLVTNILDDELRVATGGQANAGRPWKLTREILLKLMTQPELADFMTLEAYPYITNFTKPALKANL